MEEEHDRIADEALEDADHAGQASSELEQEIKDTREDWESKQKAEAVPGAVDPDADEPDEEREQPEPEYEEINPQSADASGGGQQSEGSDDDS